MNIFFTEKLVLVYFFYWLICIIGIYLFLPRSETNVHKNTAIIITSIIATVIPFFGPMISMIYAIFLRSVVARVYEPDIQAIELPAPMRDARLSLSTAAPGSISARLRYSKDPHQRLEAIAQIAESQFFEQYELLRNALSDDVEEVRLLAYSALDQREQENTELLMHLDAQLKIAHQPAMLRRLQDYRQWLDWNISHSVSRDVAEPHVEFKSTQQSTSESYIDNDNSASMDLLKGLQLLEAGKPDAAVARLKRAETRKIARSITAPPLAAAYFKTGSIEKIRAIYLASPELQLSPRYGYSMLFWTGAKP